MIRYVRTQDYHVRKWPNQPLELLLWTARDGRPYHKIVLSCIVMKHCPERCKQRHKERRSFSTAQVFEFINQHLGERERAFCSTRCLSHQAPSLSRLFQHGRCPIQLLFPVSQLLLECHFFQALPLPVDEVCILNGQL